MNFIEKIFGGKDPWKNIETLARDSIHLVTTENRVFSKIGGRPNLGGDFDWPSYRGQPLAFLAQLSFSELNTTKQFPEYPTRGRLFCFYVQDQSTWGFEPDDVGSWKTIYHEDEQDPPTETPYPEGLDESSRYPEKRITAKVVKSYPFWEDKRIKKYWEQDEDFLEQYEEFQNSLFDHGPKHQLGGHPDPQQNPEMDEECQLVSNGINCGTAEGYRDSRVPALLKRAKEWVFYFQLDSDEECEMMWGDAGMLYFWIRKEDLKNRRFEKSWMILQCG
jgi:uncharacterized protein YwqG